MPEDDEQKENTIMGGIFGVASKSSCILDLFFGIDYHSHLGTRRGGMAVYDKKPAVERGAVESFLLCGNGRICIGRKHPQVHRTSEQSLLI